MGQGMAGPVWALQGHCLAATVPAGQAQSRSDDGVRGGREIEKA